MSRATRCSACRSDGVVRVQGTTLCGSCALGFDSLPRATLVPRRSHVRAQVVSVFAAVIATLAALGTVAVVSTAGSPATIHPSKADAHGGPAGTPDVISALPGPLSDDTQNGAVSGAPATTATLGDTSSVVELAGAFVAATKAWADCVADAAPTQDMDACGDQPVPADYGLGTALAAAGFAPPGQAMQDDPNAAPPGQAKKDDHNAAPPGQAKKDDPNAAPPGQAREDDPNPES